MWENMLTLEDCNSILAFNPDYSADYTIHVSNLPTSSFNKYYYDFNIISMQVTGNNYIYTLEVYNRMWDGGLTFKNVPNGLNTPTAKTIKNTTNYNKEYYIVEITSQTTDFDIVLSLNNNYEGERKIIDTYNFLNLEIGEIVNGEFESKNNLEYTYNQVKNITIRTTDTKGNLLSGVSITGVCSETNTNLFAKTTSTGMYTFTPPIFEPGVYNFKFDAEIQGYHQVTKYLQVVVSSNNVSLTITTVGDLYKGGYGNQTIQLNVEGNINITPQVRVECPVNKEYTNTTLNFNKNISGKYETNYKLNLRGYHKPTITIVYTVLETPYTEEYTIVQEIPLQTRIIDNWTELKTEIENEKGVDYIEIPQNTPINPTNTIQVNRDITLYGQKGNTWTTIQNSTNGYLFQVLSNILQTVKLQIEGIHFTNNQKGIIKAENYSHINLYYCLFTQNTIDDKIGVCIKNPTEKQITKITLQNVWFLNNKGSCISSTGNTTIQNSHFYLNDWNYAQHPQPYAITILSNETNITNTEFYLDMGDTPSPLPIYQKSNFSWGKVPFYIQKDAILNGQYGKSLLKDNSLIFTDKNIQSYIYAKYNYDGVNSVASPIKGYERKATGHVISGRNWAWKDGIRVEKTTVYNNHNNPPQMLIPENNQRTGGLIAE